jgi:hypothetical protein
LPVSGNPIEISQHSEPPLEHPASLGDAGLSSWRAFTTELHQYQVGQEVRFSPDHHQMGSRRDRYVISRLLPADAAGNLQYQIRSPAGGQELVVREDQLSLRIPAELIDFR